MPYIGQPPVSGDTTKSFRLLDNLASFTLSFDATSSSVVDTTANTLTFANHRFVTAQRVTYADGGGTAIGGLTDGTAYFIIKVDQNTIQLASSASNANNGTAISLSSGAVGSHTLNLAFDGTNTKFKATYANGTKAKISRAGQLLISINGVLQQAQESSTPTLGFGLDSDSTIVFSQAPVSTDVLFGQILADTITNFDTQDNTLDVFTGDGSTTTFNLSKKPASNNDILVTLDGVVQYPTTTSTSNAYSVTESTLTFTAAPADGVAIQVRHIGFAGATSSAVTGLYGRTGNVTLSSSDDDITVGNVTAGIITATSFGSISGTTASFSGNVSVGGTLTYEDVTNIDSVGLITARSGVKFGASGTTVEGTSTGIGIGTDTPGSILEAHGSGATIHAKTAGATNARVRITAGNAQSSFLEFADTDDSDVGEIVYSHSNNNMRFVTAATERMRLDGGGRLLIGHDSSVGDDNNLQLVGTTADGSSATFWRSSDDNGNPQLNFVKTRGTVSSSTIVQDDDTLGRIRFYGWDGNDSDSRGAEIIAQVDGTPGGDDLPGRLIFATTADGARIATERLRIDSSGRLGVATIPEAWSGFDVLEVNEASIASSGSGDAFFTANAYYDGAWKYKDAGVTRNIYMNSDGIVFRQAASGSADAAISWSEDMRLDSSGRLLIGTTTEGHPSGDDLTVATTANTGITIRSGTSNYGAIFFSDGTSGDDEYRGYIEYDHSSNYMRFGTNAAQRMRIDSGGHIGINNTSPSSYYANQLVVDTGSDSQSGITIVSGTSAQGMLAFADGTSGNQRYQGFMDYNHSTSIMTFGVNGNTHAVLRNGGHFNASSSGNFYGDSNPDFHSFNQDESGQWTLGIRNEDSNPYGFIVRYDTDTNNAGNECYYFIADGTSRYYVRANGGIVNYQSNNANLCDEREKKNIVDLDTKWDKVKSWELKKFHYNEDADTDDLRYGVIAQQVEQSCPEVLTEWEKRKAEDAVLDEDGNVVTPAQEQVMRKGVKEQQMMWMAIKALQEAQTRIETLESQNTDLLARVTALEG